MDLLHEPVRRPKPKGVPISRSLVPSPPGAVRREVLGKQAQPRRGPQDLRHRQAACAPGKAASSEAEVVLAHEHISRRSKSNELLRQRGSLALREEELRSLAEIGRFRVLDTHDLAQEIYPGQVSQLALDLDFLKQRGLVKVKSVNARRHGHDGKVDRLEVVTLTKAGRQVARQKGNLPQDQILYAQFVKPREIEHDAQIYRAYRKEARHIEEQGGRNLRVRLDFELKAQIQKAIHAERKAQPERDINDIKRQVAQEFDLPFINNGIKIPDARIHYDLDQGSRTGHRDIEVLTSSYRSGHLRGKAQAGFQLYASGSYRATLTMKIEDEHHLLDNILEL
jgi:hypothetical protein